MRTFGIEGKVNGVRHATSVRTTSYGAAFDLLLERHPTASEVTVEEWNDTHPDGEMVAILGRVEIRNG